MTKRSYDTVSRYRPTSLGLDEEELTALEVLLNPTAANSWPTPKLKEMAIRLLYPKYCGLQLNQPVVRKLRQKRLIETGRLYEVVDWGNGISKADRAMNVTEIPFRITAEGMRAINEAGIRDYSRMIGKQET